MDSHYQDPLSPHHETKRIAILCADKDTATRQRWRKQLATPFYKENHFDHYTKTLVTQNYTIQQEPALKGINAFAHQEPPNDHDIIVYEYCPTAEQLGWVKPIIQATILALKNKLKPHGVFLCPVQAIDKAPSLKAYLDKHFVRTDMPGVKGALFTKI